MTLMDLSLKSGAAFDAPVSAGERAFALILEGEATLGAGERQAKAGDVAWVAPSSGRHGFDTLSAQAASAARLLIFASPIIDEPIAMGGPFVMNTREEILEAFADLRAGRLIDAT